MAVMFMGDMFQLNYLLCKEDGMVGCCTSKTENKVKPNFFYCTVLLVLPNTPVRGLLIGYSYSPVLLFTG